MANTCYLSQASSETNTAENDKDTLIRIAKDRIYELSNELFLMKSSYAKLEQQNKELQKQVSDLKSDNETLFDKLEWFETLIQLNTQKTFFDSGVDHTLIPDDLLPLETPNNISLHRS